jgi:hypothetical protein
LVQILLTFIDDTFEICSKVELGEKKVGNSLIFQGDVGWPERTHETCCQRVLPTRPSVHFLMFVGAMVDCYITMIVLSGIDLDSSALSLQGGRQDIAHSEGASLLGQQNEA